MKILGEFSFQFLRYSIFGEIKKTGATQYASHVSQTNGVRSALAELFDYIHLDWVY